MSKKIAFIAMAAMVAANATLQAIDLSVLDNLQFSTSAASDARRLELREEGTVGHALVSGTEYKGDPNGGAATAWNTASLTTGWQTLTSGTNAAAILKLDPSTTAIEGGRLQSDTTWSNAKTHVVRNWVVVPDGVTLTISQGAIVKFCESAGIKVLSGGKVQVNGAEGADVFFASIGNDTYGGDTNMRDGDFETNSYEIVTLNGGLWSDNGYWVTPDAQLRGYPEVTLHDSLASISDGVARIPVTVEGTRNAPFSIDWQITGAPFSTTSGTLSWTQSSEGTKYIEIPLKSSYSPSGVETFTVRATLARSVTRVNETAQAKVFKGDLDLSALQFSTSAASAGRRIELREEGTVGHALVSGTEYKGDPNGDAAAAWDTSSLANGWQTITSGTDAAAILKLDSSAVAVEGGRLSANTTWSNAKTHVVRNWVVVPDGVTLTISQGAIVKFCEMAGIKVLSGGKVQINGAEGADVFFASIGNDTYGGDTNMRDGDFETNSYEIVTLNGGLWSDNGYWVTPDAAVRPYPEVALHDAIGAVEGGVVRVPVSVSGIRNAPFSIDWQIAGAPFTSTSGTLTWSQSSEGTKFIEIPIKASYTPNSTETFVLSATRARSVNLANDAARVSVYSGYIAIGDIIENGESNLSDGTEIETRGIGGTMIAKALENITYSPRWSGAAECSVAINGERLISTAEEGAATWTRPAEPGLYTFTHKAGSETLTARFAVLGADVVTHEGTVTTAETWGTDKTHLVIGTVTVKSGVTLTIEPGAVVKFMPGAKLIVEAGGTCIARGVKFTHANDDAVGGDTLFDGAATLPVMEDYEIKGTVTDDDSTEYRYTAPIVLSGTITANTTWRGWKVYNVTGNLTIRSGVTLTVEPGAVVKFNSGVSLTVNSGATLNAIGTRAQPIVFTSIKDDEFGGDTNGDGEKTYPWAGDWARIYAGGTLNMNYCRIRYCNNNSDQGAIQGSGGTVLFDNGIIEASTYECVRMNSGSFTAHNSIFRDASMGFGYYGGSGVYVYNCVIADCTIACRASNKHFYNSVFYNCYTFLESTSSSCDHCVFYNEPGLGAQSANQVGSNGNIWGDPKFVDAENGDFRIQKGSVCINAGDAANAPEYDYYGQPRDDGAPDIGIYELAGAMSPNDLAAVAVDVPAANSTVGDTLTVSYSVANVGKQVVNGSWRDKISLVSVDGGYSIDLGTVVQTAVIAVGATNTFNASISIPTDAEGTWRVAVNVNTERDIYEGANITNNTATSTESLAISLPAREAADGFSGTATKGVPASAKFALSGTEPMVARINAPAGTIVYLGSGFMPSASSYSARAVVGADGGLIGIPAGVTSAYILVETTSSKGAAFTMTLESAALAVQSVTPTTLPYTGTTGLIIDGANFAEGCHVELGAAQFAATVVSPTRLTAQIDCSRLTAGATYGVRVIGADGVTDTLPNAVTVANVPAAPKLKATLDAPASVRRGRTLTVYIDYENVGNADLPAPIFELISEGQVFKIDGAAYTNSVKVMGLSSEAPVGTLRPGEPQRIGIPVTILAENVKWKLKSYHAAQATAKTAKFSLRELYDDDWVLYHISDDDATIANLRTAIGSTFADYYTSLGAWLGTVEPQTKDYEVLKSAFGRYQYLKASGMLDAGEDDSSTGGSPVQNLNASAARSTGVAAGATLLGVGEPTRGCNHALTEDSWMRYPRDGSIWKMCPICKKWALAVREISQMSAPGVTVVPKYEVLEPLESNKNTYIICHGNQNSVATDWVGQMGQAIIGVADVNVLAINWGVGADHDLPHVSAANIAGTVSEARRELEALEYNPSKTTLIGHSHGGHVAARLITETLFGTFERFVGLDVSTTDNWVHGIAGSVKTWIKEIKGRCRDEQVEFYKSSWNMSLEDRDQLYGKYNFAIVDEGDFYEAPSLKGLGANPIELNRHSLSHVWFRATILNIGGAFNDLGFNFKGDSSWKRLCRNNGENNIGNPAGEALAGVIRGSVIEMLSVPRTGEKHDDWRYSDVISPGKKMHSMGSLAGFGNQSETMLSLYVNSFRAIDYSIGGVSISEKLSGGTTISATINNEADNLSIDYTKKDGEGFSQFLPWRNGTEGLATGAWLIDLEGLSERDGSLEDKNWEAESYLTLKNAIGANEAKYVRRIAMRVISSPNISKEGDMPFVLPQRSSLCALTVDAIDNELFGKDKLLTERQEDGTIKYRKVLLLVATGISANPNATSFADIFRSDAKKLPVIYDGDLYVSNNFKILNVEVDAQGVFAVISKAAVTKKLASLRSPRLLAAPPTHEMSENALKPGEVVNVYANSNGVWSISLNCTESYTTAEDDELVFNRFELTDAGGEDGAPRFQNNNTICDVDSVIISGTLPTATDADGNRVCEGKLYTVQLTVSSSENEDDVTTCILDVRYDPEQDDGEDEDDDSSNEPKSCDPNEMVGDEGVGEQRLVKPGDTLTYTIYFENKSDADAAAACVEVINPLNEWLDWSSLTMLDVGYNNNVDNGLSGLHEGVSEKAMDGTNVSVRTEFAVAYYDEEGNVLDENALAARSTMEGVSARAEWYLRIIDPNGDSEGWPLDMTGGFLPPNDDTHCGEGYIKYSIRVRDGAPANVVITNSATIIFDHFNDPIETDPAWWNTVGSLGAVFVESGIVVNEGETTTIRVNGGNVESAASVKLYLAYNTVVAADIDLKTGAVDGVTPKGGLKFPLTLTWAAGEFGEKIIEIPVKTDKTVEDDEFFTLQLADSVGMELGEERVCTVTIHDPDYDALAAKIAAGMASKAEKTAWDKLQKAKAPYIRGLADPADGGKVTGSGLCDKGKKVTLKATANKNFTFLGWRQGNEKFKVESEELSHDDFIATTPSLVIDRSAKPAANSKTSTTITDIDGDVTYYAVFKSDPTVMVSVVASDGKGDAPTGKGVGKYVAGTIIGEGKYAPGKKVTLKATANKGYVFAGWGKTGDGDVSQVASIAFVMPSNDVGHVARFVTLAEDVGYAVGLSLGDEWADGGSFVDATLHCGIAVKWPIKVDALSETTVKVAGLPAGLKLVQDKDTKEYRVEGVPSAASKVDKKGVVMPSEVKFTVTTAGKSMRTFSKNVVVRPLPAWAYGTFSGVLSSASPVPGERPPSHGAVSMTVSAVGKISGKIDLGGTNYSFSANGYAGRSEVVDDDSDAALFVDAVAASGKASIPLLLEGRRDDVRLSAEKAAVTNAMFSGTDVGGYDVELWRELWKDSDNAAVLSEWAGAYTYVTANGDSLALTVDEKGVVKVAGTLGEKRKVSLSAVLHPYFADVYVAPTKADAEFFERIYLANWHEEATPGCGVAYRDAGVFASSASFDGAGSGTVTMNPKYGQAAAGKTVTLAAKPAKDSVFVKWVYVNGDGDEISDYSPTLKLVAGGYDVPVTALFAAKENVSKPEPYAATSPDGGIDMWTHAVVGVAFEGAVLIDDTARPVSFTAKNLPAGLKIDKTTGVITGRPTKPFDGMVSVTATSGANGKVSGTVEIPMKVHAIPERLRGAFSGFTTDFSKETGNPGWIGLVRGLFTATVADNGSIAVKMTTGFGAVSFKAAGWDVVDWDGDRIVCAYATMTGSKGEKLNLLTLNGINWDGRDLDGRVSGGIFGETELSVLGDRNEFAKVGGKYIHENMSWFADELVGTWDFYVNDWAETWPEVGEPTEEGLVYPYSHNLSTTGKEGAGPSVRIVVKDDGTVAVSGEFLGEKISGTIPVIVERCNDESDVYMVHFWQKMKDGKECYISFVLCSGREYGHVSVSGEAWLRDFK